jgi:hypothetical protein
MKAAGLPRFESSFDLVVQTRSTSKSGDENMTRLSFFKAAGYSD